ncbi:transcription initiation factor TFIID subunit 4 isoform X2 [Macrosteles quadrilineatus]|uniref:transcription initiation factor TFIID subunit 4 isoform X2 n=1 Tax=Macrosteles quadrilineatus TaxID=74068 RepID=UPI0023E15ACF|nr:transcription initiation factor TFIID subunit 4 isoform X2 [Macrosteles quadrilineatus]
MTYGYFRENGYAKTFSVPIQLIVWFKLYFRAKNRSYLNVKYRKLKDYIRVSVFFKGNALWVQFVHCACADQFTVGFCHKMASAKFLEEALNTDVDESAVNALVGSLETSLVTTTPAASNQQGVAVSVNQNHLNSAISNGSSLSSQKHGVLNGGSDSMNIILNSDANKVISCSNHQSAIPSVVNTVVASLHGGVQSSGYINQISSNIGLVQSNVASINKSQDSVKLVYPSSTQSVTSTVGGTNRVTYPNNQTISSLPNGNLGISQINTHGNVLNVSNANVQSAVSQSFSQSGTNLNKQVSGVGVVGMDQNKPTGTALVIKSSGNNHGPQGIPLTQGLVSVPMTVNTTMTLTGTHVNAAMGTTTTSGVPGVVTLTKPINQSVGSQQGIVGNNPTIIPANVQILNVNAIRAGTPTQPGQKTAPQRVMTIGTQQMVGARPGQPGQPITLQALQQLQGAQGGHLLLKTENGQYQLLRVGPAQTPTAAIAPNNATNTQAFRVQSVPAGGAVAATVQTQVPALTTQSTAAATAATPQRHPSADTVKEKCRKFLANLLELSSREPKAVERNVRTLIQELVDTKVEPEEFCDRLERLLNASPQPCLIGFLKKSLPLLRQSMVTKELIIDGIRPPPASVLYNQQTTVVQQQTLQQGQVRPQQPPQMRVITQSAATTVSGTPPRPSPVQHRIVTPMRVPAPGTKVAPGTPIVGLRPQTATANTAIRVQTPIRTNLAKPGVPAVGLKPNQLLAKATIATRPVGTPLATTSLRQPIHPSPSILLKAVTATKEKEKKSYSSSGYTGDDDINDVAAMGGVNLAEETQRILGSTEFVGTQIRSCKDDIYLHSTPLIQKISQIAAKHGLEEPSSEVAALISHATQERLKNIVEKLAVIAEHRIDLNKLDPRYEPTQDVRGQLKFLEELDRVERKRHDEQERELLLRAAKSRSKSEDPEQAKLKAKAKEMQRAEMEELRQREANLTALQAIGPRKKPRLDGSDSFSMAGQSLRPRLKRVNVRDLLFLLETEKETCHSSLLYKSYLK